MFHFQAAALSARRFGGMDKRHFLSYLSSVPDLPQFLL